MTGSLKVEDGSKRSIQTAFRDDGSEPNPPDLDPHGKGFIDKKFQTTGKPDRRNVPLWVSNVSLRDVPHAITNDAERHDGIAR